MVALLTIAALLSCIFLCIQSIREYALTYAKLLRKKKRFTIAILTPSKKAPHNFFIKGFVAHLKKYASFEFDLIECDAQSNQTAYAKWGAYIIEQKPHLIYAIGRESTTHMYQLLKTRQTHIPLVSGGIPIESLEYPLEDMRKEIPLTGITTTFGWPEKINLLKKVCPWVKNVLVLFRSIDEISHIHLKEKNSIASSLRKHNFNTHMYHIINVEKSCDFTKVLLQHIDLIIISRSSALMGYANKIAQEAARFNTPVFSTDDTHVSHVFITISNHIEKKIGIHCAQQAIKILEDHCSAHNLPIEKLESPQIAKFNLRSTSGLIDRENKMTRALTQAPQVNILLK